jgi:adenylate cyclase
MKHSLQSEIRHSVIQFTEITGFEHIENPLDPEVYAALISDIARIHDQAIQLYQGHVDKHEGKVFMATFGVPTTHEDDPERAIRAAQLIVQKVNAYSKENKLGIGVRIGLSLGKVYAGDVGSDIKKEYTVIGDAVNIAARIMEHATESCIAVNKDIYQITRPVFKFSEPVEFTVHEITEPIHAYYVAGMRTGFIRRRGIEGLKSPLVGRVHELAMLQQHIENLLYKKGSTIILLGEAGVGKSRIIEELFTTSLSLALEKAKAINWCSGYCSPYQEAIYLPFIHIIKQI